MSVVSINLPQIGIICHNDLQKFWNILDERLEICYDALICKVDLLKGTKAKVSPIHWQHGALSRKDKEDTIDDLLVGGYSTLSLGYVGIYEMVQAVMGVSHTTEKGKEFALAVMNYMHDKCEEWNKRIDYGFSLYGTPAESLIYRFCKIDRETYGEIPNVTDKDYYTNSYHVNVTEEIDAFSKLRFEAPFHKISSGGCISYIEVPNLNKNVKAIEKVINFMYHNIQYAGINTKPDVCYKCGYKGEIQIDEDLNWICPNCGNTDKTEMQVMRRTCGLNVK